jgi:hypothetical protein
LTEAELLGEEARPYPGGVSDPHGRSLDDVRHQAELASRAAGLLAEVIALGRKLALGRDGGAKQFVRLEVSRDLFVRLAQRDDEIAEQLDAYQRGELHSPTAVLAGTRLVRKR